MFTRLSSALCDIGLVRQAAERRRVVVGVVDGDVEVDRGREMFAVSDHQL